jgi:hypothetical protein
MSDLEEIWRKARNLASEATDAEAMQKAVDAARMARELQNKEREKKWLSSAQSWATVLSSSTAAFAVVISFIALALQFYQFKATGTQQQEAAETTQWRDALKAVSIKDDSSVLSSAVQIESFFDHSRYSDQARSIAAMLLPCVTSGAGFDKITDQMRLSPGDKATRSDLISVQKDLISVQQGIIDEDWDLYNKARLKKRSVQKDFADFLEDPTDMIADGDQFLSQGSKSSTGTKNSEIGDTRAAVSQCESDRAYNPRKRALTCSYNADTVSRELARFWHEHSDVQPGPGKISLSGVVLENANFADVDFSDTSLELATINNANLSHSKFSGASLKSAVLTSLVLNGAIFTGLRSFDDSKWNGSNWWEAQAMDCPLAEYLDQKFRAPAESAPAELEAFVRWNCSAKSQ